MKTKTTLCTLLACSLLLSPNILGADAPFIVPVPEGITQSVNNDRQLKAAQDLLKRVLPKHAEQIQLEIIPCDESGLDCYEIDVKGDKVVLRGNTGVALATALNQYLKYTCQAHLSWMGDQLNLPKTLPLPKEKQRNVIQGKKRVYMNYCTHSYSAAWWDWERWQREIDFMAMNSINMPLTVTGLEAVWYNTLLQYGFSDEEARKFLVGPSHFAWQWMQNMQSAEGPLPKSWIESHIKLGQQVMERQLDLGMTPIQQGFSGFVPRELAKKYPDAKIKLQGHWCGFKGAAQLDPTDPLFAKMGKTFLEEQKKLFGAHGNYAADPFHESHPPDNSPEYLPMVGKAIHKLYKDFDPNARWVMQTWSLYEPIVKAVPKEDLLLMDLNGRKRGKGDFWGYPYIDGALHNFGGRINLHGDLAHQAENPYIVAQGQAPNIEGSGLFMEGIEQNPVFYDMAFECPTRDKAFDPKEWLNQYATRRYGAESPSAQQAWHIMLEKGPYVRGTGDVENSSILAARPALACKKSGPNNGMHIPYKPTDLIAAQELLLKDVDKLKKSEGYRFDIMDVQRQIQSNLGQAIHIKVAEAFKNRDKKEFALQTKRFQELLKDTDDLLRTRPEFNYDRYLNDARRWGTTPEEKDQYEKNATALVTAWSLDTHSGIPDIFDYSWREWSGLIAGYYLPRWKKFHDMLNDHLEKGTQYSEEDIAQVYGREHWRANNFYRRLANWEEAYIETPNKARKPVTKGDEIEIVSRLFKKYQKMAQEYYPSDMAVEKKKDEKNYHNLGEK